jgi:hypothetical protein
LTSAPRKKRTPDRRPWHPTPYDVQTIYALKNLAAGKANETQQKRALEWLIHAACGTYQPTFIPDSDRESAFAEGRRAVGLELVKLVNLPADAVKAIKSKEATP